MQEEAIPATVSVATARYNVLVFLLLALRGAASLPEVLAAMFCTPRPWLPENVGSVLHLLGPAATRTYLHHAASRPRPACTTPARCFKPLAVAFTGLALMTARFRRDFRPLLQRLDEVLEEAEGEVPRRGLLTALWDELLGEVTELRAAQGEEWAEEGAMHVHRWSALV